MRINNVPPNLQIDDSCFERLDPKGSPPPGRKSHPFVSYLQKARKHLCRNRRIREKQMEVLEMAERESRNWFVFGKIRESEMCVSDCIQKINVLGPAFCSWCHEVRTNKSKFCLFFCFKFTSYYFDIGQFRRGNEDSRGNENRKSWKKFFFCWKKSISILFSL